MVKSVIKNPEFLLERWSFVQPAHMNGVRRIHVRSAAKNRVLRILDLVTPMLIEGILALVGVGIVVVNRWRLQCAGLNRHEAEDERALRERSRCSDAS